MQLDVASIRDFYATPLGQVVRRTLALKIRRRWPVVRGQTLAGLGFASPYLGAYRGEAQRIGALMPAGQGAIVWPSKGQCLSVLVEEEQLPLPDNSVDRLLAVHCLEASERTRPLLREMWRVLSPEGRLLLIVPNRRGVWARIDSTPFGHGRPYSRGQLEVLLREALFTPVDWGGALHVPPLGYRIVLQTAPLWERAGTRLTPVFSGLIIVEAVKELVAPIGKGVRVPASGELATVRL